MTLVSWTSESRQLDCRVCELSGQGELIATITALAEIDLPVIRCSRCRSIQLRNEARDSSPTDASVDLYVEAGVGIGAIADSLGMADLSRVSRFLDVGCNYGFALDLARFLYGWDVLGVEPSLAARRGASELGLDIRDEYLDEKSAVGGGFDLILASEVVEHVSDPIAFLRAIAQRLAPDGQLILTTPAAEMVDQGIPEPEVLSAISPGYHVFLASQSGLEQLLRRAGFTAVRVERERGSLRAVASAGENGVRPNTPISATQRESYLRHSASAAPKGTALALGMSVRYLRSLVARGDFGDHRAAARLVRKEFARRYGIHLSKPRFLSARIAASHEAPPWSLSGAAFALGMIELSHERRPERAAAFFELSHTAARRWCAVVQVADLDSVDLLFQSAYHRALALSRFDSDAATAAVLSLGESLDAHSSARQSVLARRECRVYVEIASRGTVAEGGELEARVDGAARALAVSTDTDDLMAGLDALLCLAMAAVQRGRLDEARARFSECERLAALGSAEPHGRSVARSCRAHLEALGDDGSAS